MTRISFQDQIEYSGGDDLKITGAMFKPDDNKVTQFVVRVPSVDHSDRLLPVEWLADSGSEVVQLNCSKEEIRSLQTLVQVIFVRRQVPEYDYQIIHDQIFPRPRLKTVIDLQHVRRISPGERLVHVGMHVDDQHAKLGRLTGLQMDADSHKITNLIVHTGHLWWLKERTIAISKIRLLDDRKILLDQSVEPALVFSEIS